MFNNKKMSTLTWRAPSWRAARKRDSFLSRFISTFSSSRSLATHACNQNPAVFRGQRAYCNSFSTHRGIEVSNGPGTCFEPFESLCPASSLHRPSLTFPVLLPPTIPPIVPLRRMPVSLLSSPYSRPLIISLSLHLSLLLSSVLAPRISARNITHVIVTKMCTRCLSVGALYEGSWRNMNQDGSTDE